MIGMRKRVNEHSQIPRLAWRIMAGSISVTANGWIRLRLMPLLRPGFSRHWMRSPTRLKSGELKTLKGNSSWRRSNVRSKKRRHVLQRSRPKRRRAKVGVHNFI